MASLPLDDGYGHEGHWSHVQTLPEVLTIDEVLAGYERPLPPPELHEPGLDPPQPAMELAQWVKAVFLTEGGPLFQERHRHLMQADIACLWTNVEYVEGFMPVAATAELVRVSGKPWQRMMTADHLCMLFVDTPRPQVTGIL